VSDNHDTLPAISTNGVPAEVDEPVANPGLPPHTWRPTDVDPAAEKRAERQVATLFVISMLATVLFVVAYFAFKVGDEPTVVAGFGASTVALGLSFGVALLALGIGIIQWARKLMGDHEIVEMRHAASSPPEDREATLTQLAQGLDESGIGRRPLVRNTLLGALGLLGLPLIVGLRDLGPLPGDKLYHTIWATGMRVVRDVVGTPIHVSDVQIGDLFNAEPEALFPTEENGYPELSGVDSQIAKSKGAVILHRMEPSEITPSKGRENWSVDGIVAFSKICTHVGCPISLNEQQSHHLLCPCHQSTFDLTDNGRVIFGPAARPLPQLPLKVDDEGYLVAQSDFTEPVGPSFWERD
jgi:ubiquinol-cytochrome c reductase iron-sulfur subunit